MAHEQRQRSFSDSTYLKSPSVLTAEQLRKTKSYTTFPHINTQSTPSDSERASSVHRTSCFRIMPHLSDASFANQDFPTVSVLSRSSQFENYHQNVAYEISSESEDSERDLGKNEESVLHSWRRPSQKPRSYSEPLAMEPERRTRTCSLPNNIEDYSEEKRLPIDETMHKVKASPSRLQFPEQSLEKLKEENLSSRGHSPRSETSRPSSVMSLVDNCDSELGDQLFSPQELPDGDEVMGHWINRNRRQSISKQPSFSLVKEVDEGNEEEVKMFMYFHFL